VLPGDGEYLVLVGVDEKGEPNALAINEHPQLGYIARIFTNEEEFGKYLELRDAPLGHYRKMTVEELAPVLKANKVNQVVLDRGSDGWWERFYLAPHMA